MLIYKIMISLGRLKGHIMSEIRTISDRTVRLLQRLVLWKDHQRKEDEVVGYEVFPFEYLPSQPKGKLR